MRFDWLEVLITVACCVFYASLEVGAPWLLGMVVDADRVVASTDRQSRRSMEFMP